MKKNKLSILVIIMLLFSNFVVVNAAGVSEELPSKYDLRDVNGKSYVTPARNQGRAGSCWAFAAMSSLESAIMKNNGGVPIKNNEEKLKGIDFIDLSEEHMDSHHGYDYNPKESGRYECAVSYLNSRKGPYLEKDFPFGKVNDDGTYELPDKKEVTNEKIPYFVQGIEFIENVDVHTFDTEKTKLDKISATKKAIMNYGAVSSNIYQSHDGKGTFPYTNEKYYNKDKFAYYCDGKDGKYNNNANHAITIVGWDDNFSKENFKTKPKYNGAWICKEEQGSSFGDNGFYYVSYESVCVTTTQYCFKDVVKSQQGFDGIVQNETLGLTGFMGNDFSASDGSDTYFNVFTAKEDSTLEAVGFYSMGNNSDYKVYIIDNFKNFSNEFDGVKNFSEIGNGYLNTSGKISNAGYSTIKLSKPLNIKKGQEYAIGLWMDNNDSFNWMNINNERNDYVFETKKEENPSSKQAKINNNETYVYDGDGMFNMDGETSILVDTSDLVQASSSIKEFKNVGNLCLKGYYNTNNKDKLAPIITIEEPEKTVKNTGYYEKVKLHISVVDKNKNSTSSGLKSIAYNIDNGERVNIPIDKLENGLIDEKQFEVEVSKEGEHTIIVEAEDNSENSSTECKTVKIYKKEDAASTSNSGGSKHSHNNTSKEDSDIKIDKDKDKKYNVRRLGGLSRYLTALKIAEDISSENSDNVVLASSVNFPDALGGSILASKYNSPILLIDRDEENNKETMDYIKQHLKKDGNVYLLGGTGSISENVVSSLKLEGYSNFKRLGGEDRYETNLIINDALNIEKGSSVIISNSMEFADSLSISSIAGVKQMPIYITNTNTIKDETLEAIKKISPNNIYIVGGTGAVSYNIENKLKNIANVTRLGGKDRYETSINIAKYFNQDTKKAVIANGLQFPDSLTGSVLAAKNNAPILLIGSEVYEQKHYLDSTNVQDIYILGGTGSVSEELIKNLNTIEKENAE